jgi:hypothetical protein
MSTFIAEHPLAAGFTIALLTFAACVISLIVISCVRLSSKISREEEDDAFDYGAIESDLRNHVAKINAETANV